MRPDQRNRGGSFWVLVVAMLLVGAASLAHAMVEAPYARIFASKSGRVGVKVVPDAGNTTATAVVFALARDGTERELWRRNLPNIPGDVQVFEAASPNLRGGKGGDMYMVTLDTWGRAGGDHALVVYGSNGKTLHDLNPADLLPPKAKQPVAPADGGVAWREGASLSLALPPQQAPMLELTFSDGLVATITLPSGPVVKAARPAHPAGTVQKPAD